MKKAIFALLLLQFNLVNANSITVYGYGADRESAKQDAFRTAIENVCGTAVLSDREHKNNHTTHNNITTYSSCRVEKYEILEDSGDRVKVNVTLTDSKISNRLYNQSNNKKFDVDKLRTQIDTLIDEQKKGDQLIDEVFRDYPYRAFNLNKTIDPYITNDDRRNLYIMIPYDVGWNYNFIKAMNDTFRLFATNSRYGNGIITVMAKDPNDFLFGHRDDFIINDISRLDYIKSKLTYGNELRLNIKVIDNENRYILNTCYKLEYKSGAIFYSIGIDKEITMYGNDRNKGTMRIKLTVPANNINDISVNIVAAKDCLQ